MKRALVIDGGGLKGIIPATVCKKIEEKEGKAICKVFDLICGTSTGSVIGGTLAAGVKAANIAELYITKVPKFFTKRNRLLPKNWGKPEFYDRVPFMVELGEQTQYVSLSDVKTLFVSTAFNLCSKRTHFIHSDDPCENIYSLTDVISWSALSAALYFGKICVPGFIWSHFTPEGEEIRREGAVFQDGGQGTQNSPVTVAVYEMLRRWRNEDMEVISLGCGDQDPLMDYKQAAKTGIISQIKSYLGQARNESGIIQHIGAEALDACWNNFSFRRLNCTIPEKIDKLDGKDFVNEYITLGEKLAEQY